MKISNAERIPVWIQAIGIALFLVIPALFAPRPAGEPFFNLSNPTLRDILSNLFMIVFFYTNYYFLIPKAYLKQKHTLYWLSVLTALVIIILLPSLITGFVPWASQHPPSGNPSGAPQIPQGSSFLVSINHIVLLFVSVVLFSILLRVRERLYDTEKAKTRVELITLRDQINPHFLFNVLNNIYSQAIQDDSEKTASSIVKLSKMMRYVVHQARDEYVPLAKELEYLDNYIDLQRERLDRSVEVSYLKELDDPIDLRIAPLLLIPFVENAFKHGISTDEASSIVIEITLKGRLFSMLIRNRKVTGKLAPHEVSGRGIEATKERLLFLYPDKHQLILESLPDQFVVNLQIQLDAKSDSDR